MILLLVLLQQLGNGPTINMQMPDPKRISGIPLPAPDLAPGSVRIRVVRKDMSDYAPDQPVDLVAEDGTVKHGKSDQTGYAHFDGLSARVTYKLVATIDGKKVESRPFPGPQQGGLKFMLVGAAAGVEPEEPSAKAAPMLGNGPTMNMNMPDPKRLSGIPLPAPDVPAGAVTVRVVKDEITSLLPGVTVELSDGRKAKTDQTGHVTFKDLKPGTTYKLKATIEGKTVESRPFQRPPSGGYKMMLVGAAAGQQPEEAEGEGEGGEGENMPPINPLRGQPAKPDDKVPAGTVEVRLKDPDGKPLAGQKVLLVSVTQDQKMAQRDTQSDKSGVARFDKIAPSTDTGYLVAFRYEGVPYNSAPFKMPDKPGLAVELQAFRPTRDGSQVVIGPQSHLVMLVEDERLEVMENLILENRGEATWDPGPDGVVFELPAGFAGAQPIGDDAPPQFTVVPKRGMAWKGPVPPGQMQLRFAFTLPLARDIDYRQTVPLAMQGVRMIVERMDGLEVDGPVVKIKEPRDDKGRRLWLVGNEDVLPRGGAIELSLHGLPLPDKRGAWFALAVSLGMAGWGFAMSRQPGRPSGSDHRKKLEDRREKLLGELVTLEEQHAAGRIDDGKHKARREELVSSLERVYRELDAEEWG